MVPTTAVVYLVVLLWAIKGGACLLCVGWLKVGVFSGCVVYVWRIEAGVLPEAEGHNDRALLVRVGKSAFLKQFLLDDVSPSPTPTQKLYLLPADR